MNKKLIGVHLGDETIVLLSDTYSNSFGVYYILLMHTEFHNLFQMFTGAKVRAFERHTIKHTLQ